MPSPPDRFLGIDLGTSSLKVALVGAGGQQLATAEAGYEVDSPHPGWAQTDPRVWEAALDAALTRIAPALATVGPRAVGVTGQMHGAVLCDDTGATGEPARRRHDGPGRGVAGRARAGGRRPCGRTAATQGLPPPEPGRAAGYRA